MAPKKNQPKTNAKSNQPKSSSGQVNSTNTQNNLPINSNTVAIAGSAAPVSSMKPMNISSQNVAGQCKLKCDFSFNYSTVSNPTATNYGTYIQLTYNDNPCVTYNNVQYKVSSINIYAPSLHYYNGSAVSGEMCITHVPLYGGNSLMVYIPISTLGVTVNASSILQNIVTAVSTMAPSAGQNTNKGTGTFNLNDVVPKKSFYTYSSGSTDVIVYGVGDAIGISGDSYSKLSKIIIPVTSNPTVVSTQLFMNSDGPSISTNNLTMDCQELDIGEPLEDYIKNKNANINDINGLSYFIIIIIIVSLLLFAYLLKNYFVNTFENLEN
jgi:hypothetical protein